MADERSSSAGFIVTSSRELLADVLGGVVEDAATCSGGYPALAVARPRDLAFALEVAPFLEEYESRAPHARQTVQEAY